MMKFMTEEEKAKREKEFQTVLNLNSAVEDFDIAA